MDKKFNQIYYSDDGYWRGKSAIQKLAKKTDTTKEEAEKWLLKQPIYQIYLPPPKYVPRPNASMSLYATPNDIHQADILYLPHDVIIQRGDPSQHRSQGIVERFNRTLADRLFTYQYHKELEDPSKSNRKWVSRLQNVVDTLNNEKTRLIDMKPVDAIKETLVRQGFSQPAKEYEEKLLDVGTKVRYLYEPGELEGLIYKGQRVKRSTDPIWSVDVYKIKDRYIKKHQPTLYYLDGGPKRSFVSEELQPIQDL